MLGFVRGLLASSQESTGTAPSPRRERITVATCVVLLEIAHADGEFRDMEGILLDDLLEKKFDLSAEARSELVEFAGLERESSLDLYRFTREINEHFSEEEKFELMKAAWHIVCADGVLDKYEEFLARRLASLLRLSHGTMIEAKVQVLDRVGRENIRPG